jgi:hypothetical protein
VREERWLFLKRRTWLAPIDVFLHPRACLVLLVLAFGCQQESPTRVEPRAAVGVRVTFGAKHESDRLMIWPGAVHPRPAIEQSAVARASVYDLDSLRASAWELPGDSSVASEGILRNSRAEALADTATRFRLSLDVTPAPFYDIRVGCFGRRGAPGSTTEPGLVFYGATAIFNVVAESTQYATIELEDIIPNPSVQDLGDGTYRLAWTGLNAAQGYWLKEVEIPRREIRLQGGESRRDTLLEATDIERGYRISAELVNGLRSAFSEEARIPASGELGSIQGILVGGDSQPLSDVLVKVILAGGADTGRSGYTDPSGRFEITGIAPADYFLTLVRPGCSDGRDPPEGSFPVPPAGIEDRGTIVWECAGGFQVAVILTWSSHPEDLDLHLWTPAIEGAGYHVYYLDQGSSDQAPYAELDHDATDGFGPETVAIYRDFPGDYVVAVNDYSAIPGSGTITSSGATVRVVGAHGVLGEFQVPDVPSEPGWWWNVCTINAETGIVTANGGIGPASPR